MKLSTPFALVLVWLLTVPLIVLPILYPEFVTEPRRWLAAAVSLSVLGAALTVLVYHRRIAAPGKALLKELESGTADAPRALSQEFSSLQTATRRLREQAARQSADLGGALSERAEEANRRGQALEKAETDLLANRSALEELRGELEQSRTQTESLRQQLANANQTIDASRLALVAADNRFEVMQRDLASTAVRADSAEQKAEALQTRDPLTGLLNERVFRQRLESELHRAERSDAASSILIVEITNIDALHTAGGDSAVEAGLSRVGELLLMVSRVADLPARLDAHKMALLLPETDALGADRLALRIRQLLDAETIEVKGSPAKLVARTAVAAAQPNSAVTATALLDQAQAALVQSHTQ